MGIGRYPRKEVSLSFLPYSFHQGLPARRWHKIKSQWLTAEETRNATRLSNHELIDYFGKGLTPHLRTSKKPYKIHPCVHRLANGKLAVVSRRKPRERTFNYPSMDYLDELKPYMPKTFEFDPDQHEYIPNWGILLTYMEEHCLFKREEVEILKKKLSPWNRQKEKKKEYLGDPKLIEVVKEIKSDLEYLYNNLR